MYRLTAITIALLLLGSCNAAQSQALQPDAIDVSICSNANLPPAEQIYCNEYWRGRIEATSFIAEQIQSRGRITPNSPMATFIANQLVEAIALQEKVVLGRADKFGNIHIFEDSRGDSSIGKDSLLHLIRMKSFFLNGGLASFESFCGGKPKEIKSTQPIDCSKPGPFLRQLDNRKPAGL